MLRQRGLKFKLISAFLLLGMLPAGILAWRTYVATRQLEADQRKTLRTVAVSVIDKVDRNLFERYGDALMLAANPELRQRADWYKPGETASRPVKALNSFIRVRPFYPLVILADTAGKVIAVNDLDALGHSRETAALYGRNYKDAGWFRAVLDGRFHSGAGGSFTGAWIDGPRVDEDVNRIYGDRGLVMSFSSPVRDPGGTVAAVLSICALFSPVEEIFADTYRELSAQGLRRSRLNLLDERGRLLVDYNPFKAGGDLAVRRNMKELLKFNLAENGVQCAQRVVAGETGYNLTFGVRAQKWEACGYAPSKGAFGFPGLKWGAIVRDEDAELSAAATAVRGQMVWILVGSIGLLGGAAWGMSRALARPLLERMEALKAGAEQVSRAAVQVAASAQTLSDGATRQAASLEQTASSMEQMNAMVRQNSAAAETVAEQMRQADAQAGGSNAALGQMLDSMNAIEEAWKKVSRIIRAIEEIAFQTNLLALNAAVEAARAGQAGAGFAVVAGEVKSLAERAAKSARETEDLIQEALSKSGEGARRVSGAAESVARITESVTRVKALVDEMSEGTRRQARGIEQVSTSVVQMESITQQTAATAEESAAASRQLSAQAENALALVGDLKELITGKAA